MGELEKGLWHGEAPPGLEAWEEWGQMVSPHTIDDGQRLLLFDLAVPSEIENLAREGAGDGDRPDVPVARARHAEPCGAAFRCRPTTN